MSGFCGFCNSMLVRPSGYEYADPVCPNCEPELLNRGGRA
jgi:phage FluMu protein Com